MMHARPPVLSADPTSPFPDIPAGNPEACAAPVIAVGGDLDPRRLLNAYRHGIFPWYGPGSPIIWWSPHPRCVLPVAAFRASRRFRRQMRHPDLRLTVDHAFAAVVAACAVPRRAGDESWIVPEMAYAYRRLHEAGHAHSLEVWQGEALIGGLYGVLLGRLFFAESMFTRAHGGSKIALYALLRIMAELGAPFIDCQLPNPHLLRLGAMTLPRDVFLALGRELTAARPRRPWPVRLPPAAALSG